jgi:hypothetical protein
LVDEELFESESHSTALEEESRAVESRPSREEKVDWPAQSNAFEKASGGKTLLLYFLFSTLYLRLRLKSGQLDTS